MANNFEKPNIPLNAWANNPYYKSIAPIYDPEESYSTGAIILSPLGSLVKAINDTTGQYNPDDWEETVIANNLGGGGGGGGTTDHRQLSYRNTADQHNIASITGLETALAGKQATISDLATIRSNAEAGAEAATDVADIEAKIPPQASSANQLADKAFVNSTVGTNTAIFRGTFNSLAELQAYTGEKTNNDYAFVIIYDPVITTQVKAYDRYKYNGTNWVFEYELNNSSFTAVQWAAINSGITSEDVALIATAVQSANISHETWTFTLDDDSTVTKEVVLWTSQA